MVQAKRRLRRKQPVTCTPPLQGGGHGEPPASDMAEQKADNLAQEGPQQQQSKQQQQPRQPQTAQQQQHQPQEGGEGAD